ncbi:MAG: hypothetical protein JRL30_24160 [Deltaproteobacteria bacterium]|nr:hypothetical protein [Deltaproteobacteria bacterium]
MLRQKMWHVWVVWIFIGSVLFPGYACAEEVEAAVTLRGHAYFNGPIEEATVTILDVEGNIVPTEEATTDTRGNFSIPLPTEMVDMPFFIRVEGGYLKATNFAFDDDWPETESDMREPFMQWAEARVEAFNPRKEYVVSTGALSGLMGSVDLGGPVEGATVSIYDTDGVLIVEQENATGPLGAFYISDELPEDFDIVITGGTFQGKPFEDMARRNVRDFNPDKWYYVNYVTTIVATYLENAGLLSRQSPTVDEAEAAVGNYLEFPENWTFDEIIDSMDYYDGFFSSKKFLSRMEDEFGEVALNRFVSLTVFPEIMVRQQKNFGEEEADYDPFYPIGASNMQHPPAVGIAAATVGKALEVIFGIADAIGGIVESIFTEIGKDENTAALQSIIQGLENVQAQIADLKRMMRERLDQQDWETAIREVNKKIDEIKSDLKDITEQSKYVKPARMSEEDWKKSRTYTNKRDKLKRIIKKIDDNYYTYVSNLNSEIASADLTRSIMTKAANIIKNRTAQGANGRIDDTKAGEWYMGLFERLLLYQFKAYELYAHAKKYSYGTTERADKEYKTFRTDSGWLPKQIEHFVQGAETYAIQYHPEGFFAKEFPCNDTWDTFLQKVDYLAESLSPTFGGFEDPDKLKFTPKEGVFTVRIVFPVYTEGMKMDEQTWQLVGVKQNQNTTWLKNQGELNQIFTNASNSSDQINLNDFPKYSCRNQVEGKDPWNASVKWQIATAKMSTSQLQEGGSYVADKGGEGLRKTNPMLYIGGDSRATIRKSKAKDLKYGFYTLYHVPTMINQLKTFHGRGMPDRCIWVDVSGAQLLNVFAGLTKEHHSGRTTQLCLKYTGNNYYTISTRENPYHFFQVSGNWPMMINLGGNSWTLGGWKIKAGLQFGGEKRWVMFKALYAKDDTEAIYFKYYHFLTYPHINYQSYPKWQMMASGDWGKPNPMWYGEERSWGIWHPNDLRKLFPVKHGNDWVFD